MCAGLYTIGRQASEISQYGIRDPSDEPTTTTDATRVQQGQNEPFFKETKGDED